MIAFLLALFLGCPCGDGCKCKPEACPRLCPTLTPGGIP